MTTRSSRANAALSAHDARAALVDYVAQCRRDAEHAARAEEYERAATLSNVVDDLDALLRRWDIAHDGHTPP